MGVGAGGRAWWWWWGGGRSQGAVHCRPCIWRLAQVSRSQLPAMHPPHARRPHAPPHRRRRPTCRPAVLGRFVYTLNLFCKEQYSMEYGVSDYWIYEFAKVRSPKGSTRLAAFAAAGGPLLVPGVPGTRGWGCGVGGGRHPAAQHCNQPPCILRSAGLHPACRLPWALAAMLEGRRSLVCHASVHAWLGARCSATQLLCA